MSCLERALMVERSATMWSGPFPWLNVVSVVLKPLKIVDVEKMVIF